MVSPLGKLRATGNPSISSDTLTLFGSDMTAVSSALYYQTDALVTPLSQTIGQTLASVQTLTHSPSERAY